MSRGLVFDITEGSIHDGPGLRTTVFLKGCPLRCRWCHSPEGQSAEPELLRLPGGRTRTAGRWYEAGELAAYLRRCAALTPEGGVTFTGGEVLTQAEFLLEVLDDLAGVHVVVETAGAGRTADLLAVADRCMLIYYGLKVLNDAEAVRLTGVPAKPLLENLRALDAYGGAPYVIRMPLIFGAAATPENFRALMELSFTLKRLKSIEFLPANPMAPAKYASCGRKFDPEFADCVSGSVPEFFSPAVPYRVLD